MLVRNCKPDPKRLGVLAECMRPFDPQGLGGEWPGQYLSTRTVAYSCGLLAREGEAVAHAHDREELGRCRRLSAEAARIMEGVYIRWSDEGDHTLDQFCIPANAGDPVPGRITEKLFRTAMRGAVYPGAVLKVEPLKGTSAWWQRAAMMHSDLKDDPAEHERFARWERLLKWFHKHPELHAPAHVGFEEPKDGEFASVYPKLFLALTAAGSLVGLVTCVVWT
jgi:hypothetical protein